MPGVLQLAQLARMAAEDAEAAGLECELLGKFRTETTERETDRIISQFPIGFPPMVGILMTSTEVVAYEWHIDGMSCFIH